MDKTDNMAGVLIYFILFLSLASVHAFLTTTRLESAYEESPFPRNQMYLLMNWKNTGLLLEITDCHIAPFSLWTTIYSHFWRDLEIHDTLSSQSRWVKEVSINLCIKSFKFLVIFLRSISPPISHFTGIGTPVFLID